MADVPVPAHVRPFVEILGLDETATFLLEFGGAECHFTPNATERSQLSKSVGLDKAAALGRRLNGPIMVRVPTARSFVARVLHQHRGYTVAQISRCLHVSDVTVRNYLKPDDQKPKRQLSLFSPED